MRIFETPHIYIEPHESEVPWVKIFTQLPRKEFSDCTHKEKMVIWQTLDIVEKCMIAFYKPEKINLASFGNMLPHVHWHVMARFKEDSYFPEPMWGEKQREGKLELPPFEAFVEMLRRDLMSAAL